MLHPHGRSKHCGSCNPNNNNGYDVDESTEEKSSARGTTRVYTLLAATSWTATLLGWFSRDTTSAFATYSRGEQTAASLTS
jgi:hypothetical protein